MHKAAEGAKTTAKAQQARERVLAEWLGIKGQQYRDPAGTSNNTKVGSEVKGPVRL